MYSNQDDSYHMPATSQQQFAEIQHQIRRLANHPAIVIWDGCNECGGSGVVQVRVKKGATHAHSGILHRREYTAYNTTQQHNTQHTNKYTHNAVAYQRDRTL